MSDWIKVNRTQLHHVHRKRVSVTQTENNAGKANSAGTLTGSRKWATTSPEGSELRGEKARLETGRHFIMDTGLFHQGGVSLNFMHLIMTSKYMKQKCVVLLRQEAHPQPQWDF